MLLPYATYADDHLSEEDIKSRFIQPALEDKGWDKFHMRMEYTYTAEQIVVRGTIKHRKRGKRVDYLLYTDDNYPIAVVEAKDHKHAPSDGIQQAIDYAHDLDVPYAYATNGEKFVEHDMTTDKERTFNMDDFPTPLALRERHRQWMYQNSILTEEGAQLLDIPYYNDSDSYPPRYYQRIAINIENPQILNLNPFAQIAKRPRIMKGVFGSPEEYNEAVRELENELYNIA